MLQVTAQELTGRQFHILPLFAVRSLVAEGDLTVLQCQNPVVGDGDPVDVSPQISEHLFCPVEGRFAEDHPLLVPDLFGEGFTGQRFLCHLHEPVTKASGECTHRDEELVAGLTPLAVLVKPTGRNEHVHMGVVLQCSGPGVENGEDAELAADISGVEADGGEAYHSRLDQDVVEDLLVAADDVSQFRREGEDEMKVAGGEQFRFPRLQPALCIAAVAFGAASVFAGVVGVLLMTALFTLANMASHAFRAAVADSEERLLMAGEHPVAVAVEVRFPVGRDDMGQFHYRSAMSSLRLLSSRSEIRLVRCR